MRSSSLHPLTSITVRHNAPILYKPLAEQQRRLGLTLVVGGGGAACDHRGPCVAAQRLLQDSCQLAVSVRYVNLIREPKREKETGQGKRPVVNRAHSNTWWG